MQIKFNYTSGGEFTLNGERYVGYFNVDDSGNVYTDRYYSESSLTLNSISEYSADYYKSTYFKDRFVYDDISLPYSLNEILIQPNELVNFNVLNKKIEYFHHNLIYMYSKLYMGSTDVPVDQNVNTLCNLVGTSSFNWEGKLNSSRFGFTNLGSVPSLSGYKEFDQMKRFVVIPFDNNKGLSIIAISQTHVMALSSTISNDGQLSGAEFVLYTDVIDNNSNEKCKNLEDITFDGRYLYISDSKINRGGEVFKYDVASFYTNDKIFAGQRYLIEPIGGIGDVNKTNKFDGCSVLGAKPNELWVYDSGNNVIKVYNTDFVFKKTIKIPMPERYSVLDIRHRIMNNHTYVLFKDSYDINNLKYGLFEYDANYKLAGTYVFEDVLYSATDGSFNRIAISEQDSNVFYAITNSSVYKKFFSRPEKTFAVFNRDGFYPDDTFIWDLIDVNWENLLDYQTWNYSEFFIVNFTARDIFIAASDQNKDDVFFMGDSYISHLNEKTDYLSLLRHDNLPYYNYQSIKLEKNEYNQGFVLNKEIYKLFSNIIQFKNNLKGKFYAEYNRYGDLIYNDYIYLTDEEINTLNIELEYNSFVNDNELCEPNVINRIFNKIYEFQYNLLKLSEVKIKNLKTWVDLERNSNIYPIS